MADGASPAPATERVSAPALVATVGLHGSASTWAFNVARELMTAAFGEGALFSAHAQEPGQIPTEASSRPHMVLKSHHGCAALDAWLKARGAVYLLSIRDPRDAALSMSQRFGAPLGHTVVWLTNDCNRLLRLLQDRHLLLRYENRFFDDRASVERIASWLGAGVTAETIDDIFDRYRTEAVREFAARLDDLPVERIQANKITRLDRLTQIHRRHIGDGRTGKWRDLPIPIQNEITGIFGPFLDKFGYDRSTQAAARP